MPALYQCRTSLREVAAVVAATAPRDATWSAELWPGRHGLIARNDDGGRVIETMEFGIASAASGSGMQHQFWFRELWPAQSWLLEPPHRCLVIADRFAVPEGPTGHRTRSWIGHEDDMVFAWAGIWYDAAGKPCYAGLLVKGDEGAFAGHSVPAVLDRSDQDDWLSADIRSASRLVRQSPSPSGFYIEATEEPWVSNRVIGT